MDDNKFWHWKCIEWISDHWDICRKLRHLLTGISRRLTLRNSLRFFVAAAIVNLTDLTNARNRWLTSDLMLWMLLSFRATAFADVKSAATENLQIGNKLSEKCLINSRGNKTKLICRQGTSTSGPNVFSNPERKLHDVCSFSQASLWLTVLAWLYESCFCWLDVLCSRDLKSIVMFFPEWTIYK